MTQDEVIFQTLEGKQGNIGLITLNRPPVLNALNLAMCQSIDAHLARWAMQDDIKAVVIRGEGERAFCAGGDVRHVYALGPERSKESLAFFEHEYRMNHRIFHFPKPYIALLHGVTMGGGLGVSLHGSHCIGSEDLMFAMPETGIGYFPDVGGSYFLPRLSGKMGWYLGLTGDRINCADACFIGAIKGCVPREKFDALLSALQETPFSQTSIDDVISAFSKDPGVSTIALKQSQIDHCFSVDNVEMLVAELSDHDEFESTIKKTLLSNSPTSLQLTFELLKRGTDLNFDQCMQMEYQLCQFFLKSHDFYEGVRAAVIDKDRKPVWRPAALGGLLSETVLEAFERAGMPLDFT